MVKGMAMAIMGPIKPAGCSKFLSINRIDSLNFIFRTVMLVSGLPAKYNFLCYRALGGCGCLERKRKKNYIWRVKINTQEVLPCKTP